MEIHASCKLDLESIKALTRLGMFRKADPRKRMILWGTVYGVLFLAIVFLGFRYGFNSSTIRYLILLIVIFLLGAYVYFLAPRVQYKAMSKLQQAENQYVFWDDKLQVTTAGQAFAGTSELSYSMLVRAFETSRYFFLYQTKNQVLLVDKTTITGGTAEDIRNRLTLILGKKYIRCRY